MKPKRFFVEPEPEPPPGFRFHIQMESKLFSVEPEPIQSSGSSSGFTRSVYTGFGTKHTHTHKILMVWCLFSGYHVIPMDPSCYSNCDQTI